MKITSKDILKQNLQNILVPVFEWDVDGRENNKIVLRHVIEKLLRKLGRNTVEESIPEEHKKLIRYIIKQEKIAKKKKEVKRNEYKALTENLAKQRKKARGIEDEEIEREDEELQAPMTVEETGMMIENNNLLLKFDSMVDLALIIIVYA